MLRFAAGLLILLLILFLPIASAFRIAGLLFGVVLALQGALLLIRGGVMVDDLYKDPFWKHVFGISAERRALGGALVLGGLFTLGANIWVALLALLLGGALIAVEFFYDIDSQLAPYQQKVSAGVQKRMDEAAARQAAQRRASTSQRSTAGFADDDWDKDEVRDASEAYAENTYEANTANTEAWDDSSDSEDDD